MARKKSHLKNCWVCYERPSAGKIPDWLIINFTDPFMAHSLPLTGKPLNFTEPLIHLARITSLPGDTHLLLVDVAKYLWNTNIVPGFNVSRAPSCPNPNRTHRPNGSNRTGIPCLLGDTVTCHCNGICLYWTLLSKLAIVPSLGKMSLDPTALLCATRPAIIPRLRLLGFNLIII
jgi:hypothetical protein